MPNVNPTEELVTKICNDLCFRDFVAASPKFSKGPGREREIADVLILFDELALAIQVKGKAQPPKATVPPDVYQQRLTATLDEAAGQLKGLVKALSAKEPVEVTTGIGQALRLDPSRISSLVGIIILDLAYEDDAPSGERTRILNPFSIEHGMPVHSFMRQDFAVVANEYDTLPDLLQYLRIRERLYGGGALLGFTQEEDLVAVHKMNDPAIEEVLQAEGGKLLIEPGRWEHYQRFARDIEARREANRVSYLVDAAIADLHKGIGFSVSSEDPDIPADEDEPGTLEAHLAIVTRLARFSRLERRLLGERLLSKMKDATSKRASFGVVMVPERGAAVVVAATKGGRHERRTLIGNLTAAAVMYLGVDEVVGMATQPIDSPERSFDCCLVQVDMLSEEGKAEYASLASKLFGPQREQQVTEFPEPAI